MMHSAETAAVFALTLGVAACSGDAQPALQRDSSDSATPEGQLPLSAATALDLESGCVLAVAGNPQTRAVVLLPSDARIESDAVIFDGERFAWGEVWFLEGVSVSTIEEAAVFADAGRLEDCAGHVWFLADRIRSLSG